jgi:hypothetical protein
MKWEDTEEIPPSFDETAPLDDAPRPQMKFTPDADQVGPLEGFAKGVATGATSSLYNDPAAERQQPEASLAGNLVGSAAQGVVLPAKRAFDAATGAVEGFQRTDGGLPSKLAGAAVGGVTGLAFGAAGRTAARIFKGAGPAAKEAINKAERELVGIGGAELNKFSQKGSKVGVDEAASKVATLKKAGLFSKGASPEQLQQRVLEIKRDAGQKIGTIYQQLDESGFVLNGEDVAAKLDEQLASLAQFPRNNKPLIDSLSAARADIADNQFLSAGKLNALKESIAESAFDSNGVVKDDVAFTVWKELKSGIDDISKAVGGETGKALKELNNVYHSAHGVLPAVAKKANKEAARPETLTGKVLGAAKDAVAKPIVVGGGDWIKNNAAALGKYGVAMEQISATRGPRAAAAFLYSQMQQDPALRDAIRNTEVENGRK